MNLPPRRRGTRRRVRVAERVSRVLITTGGIGVILAVTMILGFLLWVVVPLFGGSDAEKERSIPLGDAPAPLRLAVDEYRSIAVEALPGGALLLRRLDTGDALPALGFPGGVEPTAAAFPLEGDTAVFGFADGTLRRARLGFESRFLAEERAPEAARRLSPGERALHEGGVVERTAEGALRVLVPRFDVEEPVPVGDGSAVALVDFSASGDRTFHAVLTAGGRLVLAEATSRTNLLTDEVTIEVESADLPWPAHPGGEKPFRLLLSGVGDTVLLIWRDGRFARIDARDRARPVVAEVRDLAPEEGVSLSDARFLVGKTTFVTGDDLGRVRAWFTIRPEEPPETTDGLVVTNAHEIPGRGSPVTALAASPRSRLVAAGFADGVVRLHQMTAEADLVDLDTGSRPVVALAIAPKEDGLVARAGDDLHSWRLEAGHPEADLHTLFGKVWYEGAPGPAHVWQSTGGSDDFEPKFGLMPLVFGTLKATLYSLLFGVPLALLAAVFTSEFLPLRLRTPVKSTIEIMASLPSVVLGFIAALVVAPFVQSVVPTVLVAFVAVPAAFLLGAHLWQVLPSPAAIRWGGAPRFLLIALSLPAGILLAIWLGPAVEAWLFAGNFHEWLDRRRGDGTGAWMIALLPLSAVAGGFAVSRAVVPWIRARSVDWSNRACAVANLLKLVLGAAASFGLAYLLSRVLVGLGSDPRGAIVDTYVQKNALVVGFVMGFAIIPIIYTLAEDALSSVPGHLREASLGAGATPWQTAARIVIPTAAPGIFSAVMIGLGRAVGETMIVLMAAGNTPLMDWNWFNGFRTLSANIAVEMPEAPRDGTHYRVLFLAALTLFVITFVLNTAAEVVRQRSRRRTGAL